MNRSFMIRALLLLFLLGITGLFFWLDLDRFLTLQYLKASKDQFDTLYAAAPVKVMAAYCTVYIVSVAMNLPGATILGLAAGAYFGFVTGTILVSFSSTIGATLAAFGARFLFRDWVDQKFGEKLSAINKGVEAEGAFYLFTLRLIPVFPFFMINLLMGLTRMRLSTFYWVSQAGMLPGTMVYVNAGKEIGKLTSLSGILSPSLILSFAILGLFPLVAKKSIAKIRKQTQPSG